MCVCVCVHVCVCMCVCMFVYVCACMHVVELLIPYVQHYGLYTCIQYGVCTMYMSECVYISSMFINASVC